MRFDGKCFCHLVYDVTLGKNHPAQGFPTTVAPPFSFSATTSRLLKTPMPPAEVPDKMMSVALHWDRRNTAHLHILAMVLLLVEVLLQLGTML